MARLLVSHKVWLLLMVFVLLSAGCAGKDAAATLGMTGQPPLLSGLPSLPQDTAGARQTATVQAAMQTGDLAFAKSAGALTQGTELVLPTGVNMLQWAYYRFNVGTAAALTNVQVQFTFDTGTKAWIGLSNYTKSRWELAGPFSMNQTVALNGGPDYISAGGYFYALVASYNLNTVRIQRLLLNYDDGSVSYSISGTVLDSGSLPISGSTINVMPGNNNITVGPTGAYTVSSLAPGSYTLTPGATNYTFVPASTVVNVSNANVTGKNFTGTLQGPTVSYVADARPFFVAHCIQCHHADKPLFLWSPESYDSALTKLAGIKTRVQNDHNGTYSAADKTMIAAWVDAGGPLGATATHYTDVLPQLFYANCLSCHSSTVTGGARGGAPMDVNFDTYAAASGWRTNNKQIAIRANTRVQAGTMPPAGAVSPALKALIQAWIDSGWPN
jgi:hypothetical protein